MKKLPQWGSFHRIVREAWTETDLALLRQDRIDKAMDEERNQNKNWMDKKGPGETRPVDKQGTGADRQKG